jgi:hypothetical protein
MLDDAKTRDAYKSANAIVLLTGWTPTAEALAIQEKVIHGELTHNQAVGAHIAQIRAACETS